MNFYNKYILPRLINLAMKKKDFENLRPDITNLASGTVLEIGFGSGLNTPYYKNIDKLYALEPSAGLYKMAQSLIEKSSFPIEHLDASAEQIPLANASVDSVVSTWTMCSIPNPAMALNEIRRVLRPSGRFIFIEHGLSPKKLPSIIQKLFTPITRRSAGGCHLDRNIEKLILNSGLIIQTLDKFEQKSKPLAFMYKGVATKEK